MTPVKKPAPAHICSSSVKPAPAPICSSSVKPAPAVAISDQGKGSLFDVSDIDAMIEAEGGPKLRGPTDAEYRAAKKSAATAAILKRPAAATAAILKRPAAARRVLKRPAAASILELPSEGTIPPLWMSNIIREGEIAKDTQAAVRKRVHSRAYHWARDKVPGGEDSSRFISGVTSRTMEIYDAQIVIE